MKRILFLCWMVVLYENLWSQKSDAYADVIVEAHFEPNNTGFKFFYGGIPTKFPYELPLTVVLEEDNQFISLPKGSYLVLQFTDNFVIDGEGADIFLKEIGPSGERASVWVSDDGVSFTYLGVARDDSVTALDLQTISYKKPVRFIKIIGMDNNGGSPGFDLECVYALPRSNMKTYTFLSEWKGNEPELRLPVKFLLDRYNYTERDLTPDVLNSLIKLIEWLKQHPNLQVRVLGHCDDFGSKEFQQKETESRAKYVYDFMIKKGLQPKQIEYIGMGSAQPLKSIDGQNRSINRRIEIEIIPL